MNRETAGFGHVVVILLVAIGAVAAVLWGLSRMPTDLSEPPKQFIQADFIDLDRVFAISKFRSGSGHDFSGNGESCRSMKHYFNVPWTEEGNNEWMQNGGFPAPPAPGRAIPIYSPVDGHISQVAHEKTMGSQIYINPQDAPGYTVRLFHIYLLPGFGEGSSVAAGQQIGEIGLHQNTDIAITKRQGLKSVFLSYFEVMPDEVFAQYQKYGIGSRSDFIISREERDANPLQCNGEEFVVNIDQQHSLDHFIYLNDY